MHDILGTMCLLIALAAGVVLGVITVYESLGLVGVITAFILLAMTALLYYKDKI